MARHLEDKSPAEIKWLLDRVGMTYAYVDREHNLAAGTACKAARCPHFDGEMAIAYELDLSPRQIWPSRYVSDDVRLKPQPRDNYKAIPKIKKCQKRKAA